MTIYFFSENIYTDAFFLMKWQKSAFQSVNYSENLFQKKSTEIPWSLDQLITFRIAGKMEDNNSTLPKVIPMNSVASGLFCNGSVGRPWDGLRDQPNIHCPGTPGQSLTLVMLPGPQAHLIARWPEQDGTWGRVHWEQDLQHY